MARKNKVALEPEDAAGRHRRPAPERLGHRERRRSAAKRRALAAGRHGRARKDDLEQASDEFIPSAQGLEKEMQELAAVLECTQLNFLPPDWRDEGRPARRPGPAAGAAGGDPAAAEGIEHCHESRQNGEDAKTRHGEQPGRSSGFEGGRRSTATGSAGSTTSRRRR